MLKNGVCVQDGIVYAGQLSYLSALRVSDGKLLWKYADRIRGESSVSTPGLHEGLLHATTSFGVRYALDAGTGKLVWSTERAKNPMAGRCFKVETNIKGQGETRYKG